MREVTSSGSTVDEAVKSALEQLKTTEDQVEIEIIDEGKKGLLGIIGAKRAIVKVKIKKDPIEETKKFIKEVTRQMNVDVDVKAYRDQNHVTFEMEGENIAILIGKRGQTLNALQYLTHLAINKQKETYYTVTLDAEGYRERRRETLESLAHKMAERAKRINKKVVLEPMPAFERKIIHQVLQDKSDITTYSDGQEPHRYIVIKP